MGYKARWGPMGFVTSPTKIVPFENLTTSISLKTDSENDAGGSAATNIRGLELQPMTFTATYMRAAGVDPLQRFNDWAALVGSIYPLYIGEKRFGPAKLILKKVDLTDQILDNNGAFLSITLNITLEEYPTGTTSSTVKDATASRAAAVYAETVAKKKAMNTTASVDDRRAKKPTAKEKTS